MSLREYAPASLADTIAHTLRGWQLKLEAYRAWRAAYGRTCDELSTYTDRELVDLGICRADIPSLARQQADRVTGGL